MWTVHFIDLKLTLVSLRRENMKLLCFILSILGIGGTQSLIHFVQKVMPLQGCDLHFVSDFQNNVQSEFINQAMGFTGIPFDVTNISNKEAYPSRHLFRAADCKNLPSKYDHWYNKHSHLFVFWLNTSNLPNLLTVLAKTVARCPTEMRPGVYYPDSMFIFYLDEKSTLAMQKIFDDPYLKMQKNVLTLTKEGTTLLLHNYNLYDNKVHLNQIWNKDSKLQHLSDAFPRFNMNGYQLKVQFMPFSPQVTAVLDPKPASPNKLYVNHSGYEIDMIKAVSSKLNFSYDVTNPKDMEFGNLRYVVNWTGMMGDMIADRCDLAMKLLLSPARLQVVLPSVMIESDSLVFASPMPAKYFSPFSLVRPLTYPVWISLLGSLVFASVLLFLIAQGQKWFVRLEAKPWKNVGETTWFLFSVFFSQYEHERHQHGIPSRTNSTTLRIVIVCWVILTFITTAGYQGTLRAFLIIPTFRKTIETFPDMIKGGIPWDIASFGTEGEVYMARSTDPIISEIWRRKISTPKTVPRYDRLVKVIENKMLAIEYKTWLELEVYTGFTTPAGKPLIHISDHDFFKSWTAWGFSPLNPWNDRLNMKVIQMIESGLIREWKKKTMDRLKRKEREYKMPELSEGLIVVTPLMLKEVMFVFLVLASALLVCSAVLAAELLVYRFY